MNKWVEIILRKFTKSKPAFSQMEMGGNPDNNQLMVQFFEWESVPPEGVSWWQHFESQITFLNELGCTQVWLPPPNKAMVPEGRGYDAYDLVRLATQTNLMIQSNAPAILKWDLGEFDQKGTTSTRWGTKGELLQAIKTAKASGIDILIDAVLNHKLGADRTERFTAVEVDQKDRRLDLGSPKEIEGWTAFDFPGRQDKYSAMKWTQEHFTGVDWDEISRKSAVYKIVGPGHKGWSKRVDGELGNYDYLLGIDIDFRHPDVRKDFLSWSAWILEETGASGFRLDACKHIDREFLREFVLTARKHPGYERAFVVAEFWIDSVKKIEEYMSILKAPVSMFDVPLHHNFYRASQAGTEYDLRTILKGSLVERRPLDAVTFVDNHDTAIGCSLESWVGENFKLVAYALILLRPSGHPCVYHADLYGPGAIENLPPLMKARKQYAYGKLTDHFDSPDCISFTRQGDAAHPAGCVVLCANGAGSTRHIKELTIAWAQKGSVWRDILDTEQTTTISESGSGTFSCPASGVAVFVMD